MVFSVADRACRALLWTLGAAPSVLNPDGKPAPAVMKTSEGKLTVEVDGVCVATASTLVDLTLLWAAVLFIYNLRYGSARRFGRFMASEVLKVEREVTDSLVEKLRSALSRHT